MVPQPPAAQPAAAQVAGGPPGGDVLRWGTHRFAPTDRAVMAIVNRTPDSFFDRGAAFADDAALAAVERAVAEGADIIDVGGVKAGPGDDVTEAEELRRTARFVGVIRSRFPDIVISVDTWRSPVAGVLAGEGADVVNDTWGGVDPALAGVAAAHGLGLVCAHAGGAQPRTRPHRVQYDDVVADVLTTVSRLADAAVAEGVRADGIVIDPAHDFGKSSRHSWAVSRRLGELTATGWPVLVALSRKDFLGEALDLPPAERLEATLAMTALAAVAGARIFRAHDVQATRRVLDTVAVYLGERDLRAPLRGLA